MNLYAKTIAVLIQIVFVINLTNGMYLKNTIDKTSNKISTYNNNAQKDDEWNVFQDKLRLSNQKVQLPKSQKDKEGTLELQNRFGKVNPGYKVNRVKSAENPTYTKSSNNFLEVYSNLLNQMKLSQKTLKTSLNFELGDNPTLKRSRRKIAVKMVSDIPSEKIDELLKVFNEQHGINKQDKDDDNADSDNLKTDNDFNDVSTTVAPMDHDYMYDNFYEDGEDLAVPPNSYHNSHYASLQDLFLRSSSNES